MENWTATAKKTAQRLGPQTVDGIELSAEQAAAFKWLAQVGSAVDMIGPQEIVLQLRGPAFVGDDTLLTVWAGDQPFGGRPLVTRRQVAQILSKCRLA
jgi:hypothetical protein